MTKRKSFVIHIDSMDILDDLTDEQAGQLFKAIKSHQKSEAIEVTPIVKIAFAPFKNQFIRDDEKYKKLCEKNKLIAENRYNTKSTTGKNGNESSPIDTKSTDNDSKSDSNNKIDFSPLALSSEEIKEFKSIRNKKRAAITQRVINEHAKQFDLSRGRGYTNDDILSEWVNRGWTAYKDEWMKSPIAKKQTSEEYQYPIIDEEAMIKEMFSNGN